MRAALAGVLLISLLAPAHAADPLPSWRDTPPRQAIVAFLDRVTRQDSPDYLPPAERIAVFDNDGTLWPEQPAYFQLLFAIDRVKQLAPRHPEWAAQQPFQAVLEGDQQALAVAGERGLLQLVMATHADLTTDEFADAVREWLAASRHPRYRRPFTELAYQPMLELLAHLRAHEFKTYIVSGGGIEFMRVFAERVYGVPPEQVIGSSIQTEFVVRNGTPQLVRRPALDFLDDKAGKPVAIHRFIGRRPVAAFGNSDGDLEMLQWTAAGPGPSLCLIVHHTDAEREWAYDRESHVGRLDRALDEARRREWPVVDVQRDWRRLFAVEPEEDAGPGP